MNFSDDPVYYIGLLSGTSADGIDAVVVEFSDDQSDDAHASIIATHSEPFDQDLRAEILELYEPGDNEIERLGIVDRQIGDAFAQATQVLLAKAQLKPDQIEAIGCHGQTVRHRPPSAQKEAFTLQLGDANIIAERTGIDVICDFRRRDMAVGGEGAPLAPAFHQHVFASEAHLRYVVNIGGISNISILKPHTNCVGFDVGPGNGLMDFWTQKNLGSSCDVGGDWARKGAVIEPLLNAWLTHPYFKQPPPKSSGKEMFSREWLLNSLAGREDRPEDIQRTLLELTARTITDNINYDGAEVYIAGGGAFNAFLMERLSEISSSKISTTAELGIDPAWVEGALFAWLAKRFLEGLPGNLPSVTGARQERILGAFYPR